MGFVIGEHHYNIDNKGRIIIPPKFREFLGESFVMTRGMDGCLFVFPKEEWEKIEIKLADLPMTDKAVRSFMRFFLAGASECTPDRQGRVMISPALRRYAGLEKEVVIMGMNRRIEIWSEGRWIEETSVDPEEFAGRMAELGI